MKKIGKRTAVITNITLAVLAALAVAHVVFQTGRGPIRQWAEDSYAGRISAIESGVVRVENVRGTVYTVRIAPATQVRKGRDVATMDALAIGEYAIISGGVNAAGEVEASVVRIVSPDGMRPPPLEALHP